MESLASTRAKIFRLLLDAPRTVEELAKATSVTKNAVRSQIALLQRDGIVEIQGTVKTGRRPAARYGLRPGSDVQFSKAYPLVFSALVRTLGKDLPDEEFKRLMARLGKELAGSVPRPAGSPNERIEGVIGVLKSMGSAAEATKEGKDVVITSPSCPISAAVSVDPRVCGAMEAFVGNMTGLPVRECCRHGERPGCRFEIKIPEDDKSPAHPGEQGNRQ